MNEDRARTSIRRRSGEWIVRNEEHFITDLCIEKALAAGVARFAVGYIRDSACDTESVGLCRIDASNNEGCGCHLLIVLDLIATN